MNISLASLTTAQLQRAIELKQQIEALENELAGLGTGEIVTAAPVAKAAPAPQAGSGRGRYVRTAEARAKMAAAQKARWAKLRGGKPVAAPAKASVPRPKLSAEGRARIAAATKARWARFYAAKAAASKKA